MKFSLWRQYGALNSQPVWDAFAKSARLLGHETVDNSHDSDVDVIWSVLWRGRMARNRDVWQRAKKNNKPIIVIEVGGIQRGTTWRVGLGGVNRDAYFAPSGNDNERASKLKLALKPWRQSGNHILLCGQHDQSQQWHNLLPSEKWAEQQVFKIRKYTERPIVIRPHPRAPIHKINNKLKNVIIQRPQKQKGTYDDYDIQFQGAWAVVSWSSNPGPHSVINGVPVFTGPSSLAWPVANSDYSQIESPLMPDRTQWLNDYAHTEYTLAEIANGIPLKYLTKKIV